MIPRGDGMAARKKYHTILNDLYVTQYSDKQSYIYIFAFKSYDLPEYTYIYIVYL